MAKVVKENIDEINAVITVNINKEDYEAKLNAKLNQMRKESNLKGFRKGLAPLSIIKKMFGKKVLAEEVNSVLSEELSKFFKEEALEYFGQPIPNEKQTSINFSIKDLKDYEFIFDLGLAPEFEVAGVSKSEELVSYNVEIDNKLIDDNYANLLKRGGESSNPTDNIQETDLVSVKAWELDGDALKEGGLETYFDIAVDLLTNEDFKKELLTKKQGDKIRGNVYTLESDKDKAFVRQYILSIDVDREDVGEEFELEIDKITRHTPAEANQEFFDKAFGEGKVSNEAEAKAFIKKDIEEVYTKHSNDVLLLKIRKLLEEKNQPTLPEGFLKRWLLTINETMDAAAVEKELPYFVKHLRWQLVRDKIVKQHELQVTEEDLLQSYKNDFKQYMGGAMADDSMLDDLAKRMLQNAQREDVNKKAEQIINGLVLETVKSEITLKEESISQKEFDELVKKINEEHTAQSKAEEETTGE